MNSVIWEAVLWILASPIYLVQWLWQVVQHWQFLQFAYTPRILCRNCGSAISLVGFWRCRCGYTYRGHVLRVCPICGTLPRMARCFTCGATEKLPEP